MPYNYVNFGYPAQRPAVIQQALWIGPDDDLTLQLSVDNVLGISRIVSLPLTKPGLVYGVICLPSSANVTHIPDQYAIASLRMHTIISGTIVGSGDWNASLVDQGSIESSSADFQMSIGTIKVKEVRIVDQVNLEIDLVKKSTSTPVKTLQCTRDQFPSQAAYANNPLVMIDPETQALCIAGAVEAEFPSYVHNPPTTVLSAAQKADITNYVLGLSLWI